MMKDQLAAVMELQWVCVVMKNLEKSLNLKSAFFRPGTGLEKY